MKGYFRGIALAIFAGIWAGCTTVGPNYQRPPIDVPVRWSEAPENTAPAPNEASRWWADFNDPELDSLIDRAIGANLDVAQAEARIRESRANRKIATAPLWPSLTASGSYTRGVQSSNSFGSSGSSNRGSQSGGQTSGFQGASGGGFGNQPYNQYLQSFDATWEIDLFGGTRRSVEAAQANLEASYFDRGDVLLTLLGDVARNYVELRGYQHQLEVARRNLAAQEDTLELTRARYQGGLASDLNVAQAEAQVETTAAQIPTLETSYEDAVHALGVLLGQAPGALAEELGPTKPIPVASSGLPPGLPSDLLRQRPDVRRAERQLASATAQIGVATASLYPQFSLVGSGGLEEHQHERLLQLGEQALVHWTVDDLADLSRRPRSSRPSRYGTPRNRRHFLPTGKPS